MSDTQLDVLTRSDVENLLYYCDESGQRRKRYPERNRVIVLLTVQAGLTASEIANLRRRHIMQDGLVGHEIRVPGRRARTVPMSDTLRQEILEMQRRLPGDLDSPVVVPEKQQDPLRHRPMLPSSVAYVINKLSRRAGIDASSFTGRRTFIKTAIAKSPMVGASSMDVRDLAGLKKANALGRYADPLALATLSGARSAPSKKRQQALVDVIAE
jgi:integrase/recombinase XerD